MKNKTIFSILVLSCVQFLSAQINLLNANDPREIGVMSKEQQENQLKNYIQYPPVEEKDIMWSKIVYEEIDLSEKFNHPLFFPSDNLYESERKSLWYTIKNEILKKSTDVKVYVSNNNNFKDIMLAYKDVIKSDYGEITSSDIVSYKIKGVWYVDKRYGELNYRLLGILPISKKDLKTEEQRVKDLANNIGQIQSNSKDLENITKEYELFWLWYKDLRPILHKQLVFENKNNVSRISFDQLLTSRRFTSRIIGIDNVFNDQFIEEYVTNPFMQLIESERLKNIIRDFEQDLWSN
jgi:gliding motility associated protien GldN